MCSKSGIWDGPSEWVWDYNHLIIYSTIYLYPSSGSSLRFRLTTTSSMGWTSKQIRILQAKGRKLALECSTNALLREFQIVVETNRDPAQCNPAAKCQRTAGTEDHKMPGILSTKTAWCFIFRIDVQERSGNYSIRMYPLSNDLTVAKYDTTMVLKCGSGFQVPGFKYCVLSLEEV